MNEVQDRIQEVIDIYFNGNLNKACREYGLPQSSLINVVKGKRNKPSFDNLCKLTSNSKFPVSAYWLMFGIGEMADTKQIAFNITPDDYRAKYDECMIEISNLKSKIVELYERNVRIKEDYPVAMGDVRSAKAV